MAKALPEYVALVWTPGGFYACPLTFQPAERVSPGTDRTTTPVCPRPGQIEHAAPGWWEVE